ncbi:uncharacterized protein PHALS_12906 [Plasmopara halstedii]|uniref:Uncharacterized protein n=1 Tax=Plasmopara halstedii TaxID=4781 RepID=A0A0P1ANF3_PLAHL|nr:uncharacterized protein PHALS_12906 [Plasmopara halstedii]CEG42649.1 hypothetical protein PHALS_12906 [Plasmopara halstedii]|eukprot:XP_024579018.1 hypothetical protein PHALS_12906 [Plasmopara halstedii]
MRNAVTINKFIYGIDTLQTSQRATDAEKSLFKHARNSAPLDPLAHSTRSYSKQNRYFRSYLRLKSNQSPLVIAKHIAPHCAVFQLDYTEGAPECMFQWLQRNIAQVLLKETPM